mmetsp:Transcript_45945/g.33699  ORF Transcript_45945/g.33699 Transcript_45945/m.33699 type:complete len:136 (-) Transcript_45945:346-753(-)
METHLTEDEQMKACNLPFTLLNPHYCDYTVQTKEKISNELESLLELDQGILTQNLKNDFNVAMTGVEQIGSEGGKHSNGMQEGLPGSSSFPPSRKTALPEALESNGKSIQIMDQHDGDVYFTQWNPVKRLLVSGG